MKFLGIVLTATFMAVVTHADRPLQKAAKETIKREDSEINELKRNFTKMARQLMLQQFFVEEQTRAMGSSGIKQIRIHRSGIRNYFSESHVGGSMASIHNHANNIRTVGMGEFVAVLNGVEFRTRHNDYRLYMPSKKNRQYGAVEEIPFPDVPPQVTAKKDVGEQIKEMKEWFKAFRDQDHSVRDYRKHFKPVLCYLEGAWTTAGENVDEPFDSDRHFIDAKKWHELHDRARFTSYTGSKSRLENLAFLPTKIMRIVDGTEPEFAQWNYRILCQPLKNDLPVKKLRLVDDLAGRMAYKKTITKQKYSRQARFMVDPHLDKNKLSDDMLYGPTFLDTLMEQIPGMNNFGKLYDEGLDGADPALDMNTDKPLNVGNYHRWYKVGKTDAMGLQGVHRGFSDEGAFAAKTTQERVAGLDIENRKNCPLDKVLKKRVCQTVHEKWTWAFPLEIIYLTPLSKWNPYNLVYKGDARGKGKTASDGKNGDCKIRSLQYNGLNSKAYFQTPDEFYSAATTSSSDKADTSRGAVCVLDSRGKSRKVRPSGTYVFLPSIDGVGVIRQRYPIMPVHGEGSSVWKELDALKNMVLNPKLYEHMRWDSDKEVSEDIVLETGYSRSKDPNVTPHTHTIVLTPENVKQLHAGVKLHVKTSLASSHQHEMTIVYDSKRKRYKYIVCGGVKKCRDGHPQRLIVSDGNNV